MQRDEGEPSDACVFQLADSNLCMASALFLFLIQKGKHKNDKAIGVFNSLLIWFVVFQGVRFWLWPRVG